MLYEPNSKGEVPSFENYVNLIPLRKMGWPSDVAKAVIFLASDESAYITGIDLIIDGGITTWSGIPLQKP